MTKDEWKNLKTGDIVIEKSGRERTVLAVTSIRNRITMTLEKTRSSWTSNPNTHYSIHDDTNGKRWVLK